MNRIFNGIIIVLISLMFVFNIEAEEYEEYSIGCIETGKDKGQIAHGVPRMGPANPHEFAISDEGLIYVFDRVVDRVNVYNMKLNFIKEIHDVDNMFIEWTYYSYIQNNRIIPFKEGHYYAAFGENGKLIFASIYIHRDVLPYNIFPVNDHIYFKSKEGEIHFVDEEGTLLDEEQTIKFVSSLKQSHPGTIRKEPGLEKLDDFLVENSMLLYGHRLLEKRLEDAYEYFSYIRSNIKSKKLKDRVQIDESYIQWYELIGFDKYDNSYWNVLDKAGVLVFTKYGELIARIKNQYSANIKEVSSNGDLFWMENQTGACFFVIPNTWYDESGIIEPETKKGE